MQLLDALNWRYATKKMNGETVPQDKIDQLLEAIRLSPSSSGLQPFRVLVITNPELKAKLQPAAFGQSQIVDCSHLLVFAAWDHYDEARFEAAFQRMIDERGLPADALDAYKTQLRGGYDALGKEWQGHHAAKQAYIALGIGMAAAAELHVDATPMEGFNPAAVDEILDLHAKGLRSACLMAVGYRDAANDWLVNMKKVRVPHDEFYTFM
ncbi:MAG: NAD(P)H-dependent oxidoreductase [Chitinophagaceae bacterium]|nr:NAD(P)H-dependent oxidoreductase [Chitinophagaceae bacterium]